MKRPTPSQGPRIVVCGYFGIRNLGNEASLQALLEHVRVALPGTEVSCLALDPAEVTNDYHIPARRLTMTRAGHSGLWSLVVKMVLRLLDLPRTWWLIGAADAVIVPGTGVLESTLNPSVYGLPLSLLMLGLCCRLRGAPMILMSVGAEPPRTVAMRLVVRWVVGLSTYCSVRDEPSLAALRRAGARPLPGVVRPDLAFGLPMPDGLHEPLPGKVVFGVMGCRRDDVVTVDAYVEKVASVVAALLARGDQVRLVVGDIADLPLAERIARAARCESPACAGNRVSVSPAATMDELIVEMSDAEVVVASRFHNLVAALRVTRPALSLSYAPKHAALLADFGLNEVDQPMKDFDPQVLLRRITDLRTGASASEGCRRSVLRKYHEELQEQFDHLDRLLRPKCHVG